MASEIIGQDGVGRGSIRVPRQEQNANTMKRNRRKAHIRSVIMKPSSTSRRARHDVQKLELDGKKEAYGCRIDGIVAAVLVATAQERGKGRERGKL